MSSSRTKRRKVQQDYQSMVDEIHNLNTNLETNLGSIQVPILENSYSPPSISASIADDVQLNDESILITSNDKPTLQNSLSEWAVKHNVTARAVDDLLLILKNENLDLPKCSKTLLKTPCTKSYEFQNIPGGIYYHFGLVKK